MVDAKLTKSEFLLSAGWGNARSEFLSGDASSRRYERLRDKDSGQSAILMDSTAETGDSTHRFVALTGYLLTLDLSAPRILAKDVDAGYLLIEDLGDGLFSRIIIHDPDLEITLYENAAELLGTLHQSQPPNGLPKFDADQLADAAMITFEWYHDTTHTEPLGDQTTNFHAMLSEKLGRIQDQFTVTSLRDFHAENLIWLPNRNGINRVGLLDYQDAMISHPAYDLVSLLQDARRDVSDDIENAMIARFVRANGHSIDAFRAAYALLGVQRNFRIVGVFARLAIRHGKPHYIDFIPRVWRYLLKDLDHEDLTDLRRFVQSKLAAPTDNNLRKLRAACTNHQNP